MYPKIMFYTLFFFSVLFSFTYADHTLNENTDTRNKACGELGDCLSIETDCTGKCGCDKTIPTIYDNTTKECVLDIKVLLSSMTEKYNTEAKIRAEADKIFQGVIVAALFFIVCASVSAIMACIYCCRINYTDYRLKKSIKEIAKRVGAKPLIRTPTVKTPIKPVSESCNVIVEEAGIYCI